MSPNSGINKEQLDTPAPDKDSREAERLAALDHLNAIRPESDHILQKLVDEVRGIFGTDLCMVNLNLSTCNTSGPGRESCPQTGRSQARCPRAQHAIMRWTARCRSLSKTSRLPKSLEQHWCVNYGIYFYAGTPLITSDSHAIGTLCLLSAQPIEFGRDQMRVLGGPAQAVVGRLELLGALGREQAARKEEALRSEDRQRTLDSLSRI